MSEILSTDEYFAAVAEATRYVFDKSSGKRYQLRPLFFLQRFAEGQHAFTRYEDLLEKSDEEYVQTVLPDIEELQRKLRPYSAQRSSLIPKENSAKTAGHGGKSKDLISNIASAFDSSLFKTRKPELNNYLLEEPARGLCDKLLLTNPLESRVIVMANAGFGKTTLIHRIALALSDKTDEALAMDESFLASIEEDTISNIIPCIISLRDNQDDSFDLEEMIAGSIAGITQRQAGDVAVNDWIKSVRNQLVLLIDGLDELPSDLVLPFMSGLEQYLNRFKTTRIIMTTRVSGIDRDEVKKELVKLRFHGRTILPLNDKEAKQFCEQWISETGSSPDLVKNLERIQSESHLMYLREFMRKPLELVMLLQYLPRQSYSSFNRWDLFYNILWAEITNHVRFEEKQSVFDDECKFLSYIAYQMQIRNKLTLTYKELDELASSIEKLSFYTNLFEITAESCSITVTHIWNHLRVIAQNIGTVETIESTQSVTIPLRSYQEYLSAYACCNLCLTEGELYPNPSKILEPHLNDSNWLGVLGFAIAGMEYSGFAEFDQFLSSLYSSAESINSLSNLIEIDYFNSRDAAKALCRVKFKEASLAKEEKHLLQKCMQSKSSFSFRWALSSLYREAYQAGQKNYIEAVSFAYLIDTVEKSRDPVSMAVELLKSQKEYESTIGAEILILITHIILEEESTESEYFKGYKLEGLDKVYPLLYSLSASTKSFVYVRALAELCIAQAENANVVLPYLDQDLLDVACNYLDSSAEIIKKQIRDTGTLQENTIQQLKDIINVIGLFPYQLGLRSSSQNPNPWIPAFVDALYEQSIDDVDLDQVGIAVCRYHLNGSFDEFMTSWVEDICKGRLSCEVKKDHLTKRENNHFAIVKESISALEAEYHQKRDLTLNHIKRDSLLPLRENPTELFMAGEDDAALELSLRLYRQGIAINNNNLAFLVRFLKYETEELFGIPRWAFLEMLLYDGVKDHEPYSTMNYALALIEKGDVNEGKSLLRSMSAKSMSEIAENFWYPVMWQKRKTSEGAVVCVLAQLAGGVVFPEYKEMLNMIMQQSPIWTSIIM